MFISELIDHNPYVVVNLKTKEPRMKDGKIKHYANAGIARAACSQIIRRTGNNNWDFMPAPEFEDLKSDASPEEVNAWLGRKKRFNPDTNSFDLEETTKKSKNKNKNAVQWIPVDTIEHPAGTQYSPKNKYINNPDYNTRDDFNKNKQG